MSFLQPWILWALPLIALPIAIHLINQWRYQTRQWAAMMFLLKATRSNRGLAKLRQWLILALRTVVVLGLIFAVSRPLTSGFWSNFAGSKADTMIVLMDRSPSMGRQLSVGSRQLASAFATLDAAHWVAVDSNSAKATEYPTDEALLDSPSFSPSNASSRMPWMLQTTLDYLQTNKPGSADVWICSDLQAGDWNADSGTWASIRAGFQSLPQSVRIHLLNRSEQPLDNMAIRVTEAYRKTVAEGTSRRNELFLSLRVFASPSNRSADDLARTVPVEIELEGVRSQLQVELQSGFGELRDHRITLPAKQESGWGRVSLVADANERDNDFYFVFDSQPSQRVVIVTENPSEVQPIEIAASINATDHSPSEVQVIEPNRVTSMELQNSVLVIWQANLPDDSTAKVITDYISSGGQVIFFPPSSLITGNSNSSTSFSGVRWDGWSPHEQVPLTVTHWRGDQDLLAATNSGAGLAVGQLQVRGHATLQSEESLSTLATLEGGAPLLARLPTSVGGVYFFTTSIDPKYSSLAEEGIVLFVLVQRAIQKGKAALYGSRMRDAGDLQHRFEAPMSASWTADSSQANFLHGHVDLGKTEIQQIAGPTALSTEYNYQAGVYRDGDRLFAINRPATEDIPETLTDEQFSALFGEVPIHRIDSSDGSSIIREIWRPLLFATLAALLLESILSLPKRPAPIPTNPRAKVQ